MELKELQNKIKRFDKERGWNKDWNLKDLSLNLTEEIGELWNLVKWVDVEKQKEIVKKKKEEVSDFVGDALFLILKIANQTDIDAEKEYFQH
ncbi:MazG-like family protein [Candidatus Woesearchaeota archaeon]|nr:MazG-like family protein [Candidatus Woesearchaeota archaeon]